MKLSEAILLGSTMSPQAFGLYEDHDGKRCALGSALVAVGGIDIARFSPRDQLHSLWPQLDREDYGCCPECGSGGGKLGGLIAHLNDTHMWTREKIAEYVAQFDPPEPEDKQTDVGQGPVQAALEVQEV